MSLNIHVINSLSQMCNSHTWNTNTTQKSLLETCHKNTIPSNLVGEKTNTTSYNTCGSKSHTLHALQWCGLNV